jgi:hypothetical protein
MQAIYSRIVVPALIVVPMVVALAKKKYWGQPQMAVLIYLFISGCTNFIATFLAVNGINNLPLLHLYTVLEFSVIASFFYLITDSKTEKQLIMASCALIPLLTVANVLYLNSINKYNLVPRSVAGIIILLLCINFLMKNLNFSAGKVPFFNFAVVVALLLYFSGSLTLFALSDFIISNKAIFQLIWNTHATFVLIMYLIIAVAYFKLGKKDD